ncbi:hypothetical protein IG193_01090 [Infirmifilum lucidum]|uniref:Uncharacterized protein n=1 Tax=Infirmifilum lucidum TaxID=2776706 RepID=A0A7L9FIA0_9CREN|nr:hypothetical protein [Infirmifilum lucidum]QOJ79092.1 hypothetical protein IG193_01090 [Infirmifilum lucidum]
MKAKWFRAVRPRALAVALLYTAVMVYLTLLVAFFGLAAVYAYTGAPVLLEVEKGYKTTVTPAPLLYALALTTAPLYLWRGYTSYTRGNKRALLIDPITAALIALAILAIAGLAYVVTSPYWCPQVCKCGVQEVLKISFAPPEMHVCICYRC